MKLKQLLYEALRGEEYKELMKLSRKTAMQRINQVWGNLEKMAIDKSKRGDRLYFNVESGGEQDSSVANLEKEMNSFLEPKGYKDVSLKTGLVTLPNGKQQTKINKVLNAISKKAKDNKKEKDDAESLMKKYNDVFSNKVKSGEGLLIVISKHPYDIGGMSTDRNWKSCMNLRGGEEKKYVPTDIEEGVIIAYLIKDTDKNIQNPLSRLLLNPYVNVENETDVIYGVSSKFYGQSSEEFKRTLTKIMDTAQKEKIGIFTISKRLYPDSNAQLINVGDVEPSKLSLEKLLKHFNIKNYTINEDGSVDVDGDVNLIGKGLTKIPIKFGKVTGYFSCGDNPNLTSLEGAPKYVGGNFYCRNNAKLTSLKGAPQSVGGFFAIVENVNLTTLKGIENMVVKGDFHCFNNYRLKSLDYLPKNIAGKVYSDIR